MLSSPGGTDGTCISPLRKLDGILDDTLVLSEMSIGCARDRIHDSDAGTSGEFVLASPIEGTNAVPHVLGFPTAAAEVNFTVSVLANPLQPAVTAIDVEFALYLGDIEIFAQVCPLYESGTSPLCLGTCGLSCNYAMYHCGGLPGGIPLPISALTTDMHLRISLVHSVDITAEFSVYDISVKNATEESPLVFKQMEIVSGTTCPGSALDFVFDLLSGGARSGSDWCTDILTDALPTGTSGYEAEWLVDLSGELITDVSAPPPVLGYYTVAMGPDTTGGIFTGGSPTTVTVVISRGFDAFGGIWQAIPGFYSVTGNFATCNPFVIVNLPAGMSQVVVCSTGGIPHAQDYYYVPRVRYVIAGSGIPQFVLSDFDTTAPNRNNMVPCGVPSDCTADVTGFNVPGGAADAIPDSTLNTTKASELRRGIVLPELSVVPAMPMCSAYIHENGAPFVGLIQFGAEISEAGMILGTDVAAQPTNADQFYTFAIGLYNPDIQLDLDDFQIAMSVYTNSAGCAAVQTFDCVDDIRNVTRNVCPAECTPGMDDRCNVVGRFCHMFPQILPDIVPGSAVVFNVNNLNASAPARVGLLASFYRDFLVYGDEMSVLNASVTGCDEAIPAFNASFIDGQSCSQSSSQSSSQSISQSDSQSQSGSRSMSRSMSQSASQSASDSRSMSLSLSQSTSPSACPATTEWQTDDGSPELVVAEPNPSCSIFRGYIDTPNNPTADEFTVVHTIPIANRPFGVSPVIIPGSQILSSDIHVGSVNSTTINATHPPNVTMQFQYTTGGCEYEFSPEYQCVATITSSDACSDIGGGPDDMWYLMECDTPGPVDSGLLLQQGGFIRYTIRKPEFADEFAQVFFIGQLFFQARNMVFPYNQTIFGFCPVPLPEDIFPTLPSCSQSQSQSISTSQSEAANERISPLTHHRGTDLEKVCLDDGGTLCPLQYRATTRYDRFQPWVGLSFPLNTATFGPMLGPGPVALTFTTVGNYTDDHLIAYDGGSASRRANLASPLLMVEGFCDDLQTVTTFSGSPVPIPAGCSDLDDLNATTWTGVGIFLLTEEMLAPLPDGGDVRTVDIIFPELWPRDEVYIGQIAFEFITQGFTAVVPLDLACAPAPVPVAPCTCFDGCAVNGTDSMRYYSTAGSLDEDVYDILPGARRRITFTRNVNENLNEFLPGEDYDLQKYQGLVGAPDYNFAGIEMAENTSCPNTNWIKDCSANVQVVITTTVTDIDITLPSPDTIPASAEIVCEVLADNPYDQLGDAVTVFPITENVIVEQVDGSVAGAPQVFARVRIVSNRDSDPRLAFRDSPYGFEIARPRQNSFEGGLYYSCVNILETYDEGLGTGEVVGTHKNRALCAANISGSEFPAPPFTPGVNFTWYQTPPFAALPVDPYNNTVLFWMGSPQCPAITLACPDEGWEFAPVYRVAPDYVGPSYAIPADDLDPPISGVYNGVIGFRLNGAAFLDAYAAAESAGPIENIMLTYHLALDLTILLFLTSADIVVDDQGCAPLRCALPGFSTDPTSATLLDEAQDLAITGERYFKVSADVYDCVQQLQAQNVSMDDMVVALNITWEVPIPTGSMGARARYHGADVAINATMLPEPIEIRYHADRSCDQKLYQPPSPLFCNQSASESMSASIAEGTESMSQSPSFRLDGSIDLCPAKDIFLDSNGRTVSEMYMTDDDDVPYYAIEMDHLDIFKVRAEFSDKLLLKLPPLENLGSLQTTAAFGVYKVNTTTGAIVDVLDTDAEIEGVRDRTRAFYSLDACGYETCGVLANNSLAPDLFIEAVTVEAVLEGLAAIDVLENSTFGLIPTNLSLSMPVLDVPLYALFLGTSSSDTPDCLGDVIAAQTLGETTGVQLQFYLPHSLLPQGPDEETILALAGFNVLGAYVSGGGFISGGTTFIPRDTCEPLYPPPCPCPRCEPGIGCFNGAVNVLYPPGPGDYGYTCPGVSYEAQLAAAGNASLFEPSAAAADLGVPTVTGSSTAEIMRVLRDLERDTMCNSRFQKLRYFDVDDMLGGGIAATSYDLWRAGPGASGFMDVGSYTSEAFFQSFDRGANYEGAFQQLFLDAAAAPPGEPSDLAAVAANFGFEKGNFGAYAYNGTLNATMLDVIQPFVYYYNSNTTSYTPADPATATEIQGACGVGFGLSHFAYGSASALIEGPSGIFSARERISGAPAVPSPQVGLVSTIYNYNPGASFGNAIFLGGTGLPLPASPGPAFDMLGTYVFTRADDTVLNNGESGNFGQNSMSLPGLARASLVTSEGVSDGDLPLVYGDGQIVYEFGACNAPATESSSDSMSMSMSMSMSSSYSESMSLSASQSSSLSECPSTTPFFSNPAVTAAVEVAAPVPGCPYGGIIAEFNLDPVAYDVIVAVDEDGYFLGKDLSGAPFVSFNLSLASPFISVFPDALVEVTYISSTCPSPAGPSINCTSGAVLGDNGCNIVCLVPFCEAREFACAFDPGDTPLVVGAKFVITVNPVTTILEPVFETAPILQGLVVAGMPVQTINGTCPIDLPDMEIGTASCSSSQSASQSVSSSLSQSMSRSVSRSRSLSLSVSYFLFYFWFFSGGLAFSCTRNEPRLVFSCVCISVFLVLPWRCDCRLYYYFFWWRVLPPRGDRCAAGPDFATGQPARADAGSRPIHWRIRWPSSRRVLQCTAEPTATMSVT